MKLILHVWSLLIPTKAQTQLEALSKVVETTTTISSLSQQWIAARKLAELEAQGITRPCPAREIIITDAISKAEEIMRKIEKNYPPR
jgi:hypothetical protein